MTTVTVVGLGEAGRLYATGLHDAGAGVSGYDPFVTLDDEGIHQFDQLSTAVAAADIVISLVGANAAAGVADAALTHLDHDAVFADFNTGSPWAKAAIAGRAAEVGIRFADIAVLAPVPRAGSATPLLASGTGATRASQLLTPLGVPIEAISEIAGDAAGRKLQRSLFMKGLAGVVLETLAAGRAAGSEDWIRNQMADELGPNGPALVERLVTGSHAHAERRIHEVEDALEYVTELGTPGWMADGTLRWLASLSKGQP